MTKIKDIVAYPIKQYPTMMDYFIGTDAEDGFKTVNFSFQKVSNMILGDIEYTFSLSSLPLVSPEGNGYFITNGKVDFTLITEIQISKINLSGVDLTPLMNFMRNNISEFTLNLVSKSNKNIFAYLKLDSIVESADYFTYNVSLAPGNNYLGELVDKDVYTFNYDLNSTVSTLPIASETSPGIVQLATDAETIAGINNTKAVHPQGLAAALANLQLALLLTTNTDSGAATLIANILNIPRYDLYANSLIENVIVNGVLDKGASQNIIYNSLLAKVDKTLTIGTTSPLLGGGNLSAPLTLSIQKASATQDGYLSAGDWQTFNNKSDGTGTVTEVFALTIGTTGTDVNSTVLDGTTTPKITLNIPNASATARGVLSSADWINFNSKQSTSLLENNIIVGNSSNIATGVLLSGDAQINSAGILLNTGLYGKPFNLAVGFFKYTGSAWIFDNSTYATVSDLASYELLANKQNSLAVDGTGIKYPTVDAVNAGLATKVTSIVPGTGINIDSTNPNVPVISSTPGTSAGTFDRVYYTAQVATGPPTGTTPLYDTLRNGKGSVGLATLTTIALASGQKAWIPNDMIGPPQIAASTLPVGNYSSFLTATTSASTGTKRFQIEVFLCDSSGNIIPQAGLPSADPNPFYTGKNTVAILDSGFLTLITGDNTQIGLSAFLPSITPVAIGQRFRYHFSVQRNATAGTQTSSILIGNTANSYIEAPVPINTTTVINVSTVPGATDTDALNSLFTTKAPLISPAFTGIPIAPTAAPGTNTTQLATTAFVQANLLANAVLITGNQSKDGVLSMNNTNNAAISTRISLTNSGNTISFQSNGVLDVVTLGTGVGASFKTLNGGGNAISMLSSNSSGYLITAQSAFNSSGAFIAYFKELTSGGGITQVFQVTNIGDVIANKFVKTGGLATQYLMADGSVSALTNPVTGTGVAGRVAFWNGANSQTGDTNFTWDSVAKNLRVDSDVSGYNLTLIKTAGFGASLALKNTSTDSNSFIRFLSSTDTILAQIQPATGGINISGGNVGIGVTPLAKLHVEVTSSDGGGGVDGFRVSNNNMGLNFGVDSTNAYSWINSSLGGVGARTLAINPFGGNVGIGLSSTLIAKLSLKSTLTNGVASTSNDFQIGDATHSQIFGANEGFFINQTIDAGTAGKFNLGVQDSGNHTYDLGINVNGAERITILRNGNVGIGGNPTFGKLQISGVGAVGSDDLLVLEKYGGYGITKFTQSYDNIYYPNGKNLSIKLDTVPLLTLASDNTNTNWKVIFPYGNVGIGTQNPEFNLDLSNGNVKLGVAGLIIGTAGGSYPTVGYNANPSGANTWNYKTLDTASWIQFQPDIKFFTAISGTGVGNPITPFERMTILANGNIGIGSPIPWAKLEVNSTGGSYADSITDLTTKSTFLARLADPNAVVAIALNSVNGGTPQIQSYTNGTLNPNRLLINPFGGFVGIGTNNPVTKFVVSEGGVNGFEVAINNPTNTVSLQAYNRQGDYFSIMNFIADGFTFNTNMIVQGNVQATTFNGVKRYKALVTQTSTNNPVLTVLENSLGFVPVFDRLGSGSYSSTNAAYTVNKTAVTFTNGNPNLISGANSSIGGAVLLTSSNLAGSPVDGIITRATLTIEIYP